MSAPRRISINESGKVSVVTFADSKIIDEQEIQELGRTLYYLAPERWSHRAAPPGDLYACGALWYFMLTGLEPFQAETVQEIRLRHREFTPPPLSRSAPKLPAAADALFAKLTAKDPSLRIRHATEILTALNRLEATAPPAGGGRR